jgi:hypothetical protein
MIGSASSRDFDIELLQHKDEKPTFRPNETVSVNTSAFVGTIPTGELITSGLPVTRSVWIVGKR